MDEIVKAQEQHKAQALFFRKRATARVLPMLVQGNNHDNEGSQHKKGDTYAPTSSKKPSQKNSSENCHGRVRKRGLN